MYNLARQKSIWGENATAFDPSRWLDPEGEAPSPFKFVSFNAGPRVCLGRHSAMLELQTALAVFALLAEQKEQQSLFDIESVLDKHFRVCSARCQNLI